MTLGHMSSFSFRICFRRLLNSFLPCLRLYDEAKRNGLQLSQYHYNVLLYVCSLSDAETESSSLNPGLNRGFDMFKQMTVDKVVPNEATFTNGARLERHGPFDAVIDGANMGFVNQRSLASSRWSWALFVMPISRSMLGYLCDSISCSSLTILCKDFKKLVRRKGYHLWSCTRVV